MIFLRTTFVSIRPKIFCQSPPFFPQVAFLREILNTGKLIGVCYLPGTVYRSAMTCGQRLELNDPKEIRKYSDNF